MKASAFVALVAALSIIYTATASVLAEAPCPCLKEVRAKQKAEFEAKVKTLTKQYADVKGACKPVHEVFAKHSKKDLSPSSGACKSKNCNKGTPEGFEPAKIDPNVKEASCSCKGNSQKGKKPCGCSFLETFSSAYDASIDQCACAKTAQHASFLELRQRAQGVHDKLKSNSQMQSLHKLCDKSQISALWKEICDLKKQFNVAVTREKLGDNPIRDLNTGLNAAHTQLDALNSDEFDRILNGMTQHVKSKSELFQKMAGEYAKRQENYIKKLDETPSADKAASNLDALVAGQSKKMRDDQKIEREIREGDADLANAAKTMAKEDQLKSIKKDEKEEEDDQEQVVKDASKQLRDKAKAALVAHLKKRPSVTLKKDTKLKSDFF